MVLTAATLEDDDDEVEDVAALAIDRVETSVDSSERPWPAPRRAPS
jgi:hypothetical protein